VQFNTTVVIEKQEVQGIWAELFGCTKSMILSVKIGYPKGCLDGHYQECMIFTSYSLFFSPAFSFPCSKNINGNSKSHWLSRAKYLRNKSMIFQLLTFLGSMYLIFNVIYKKELLLFSFYILLMNRLKKRRKLQVGVHKSSLFFFSFPLSFPLLIPSPSETMGKPFFFISL
jgi:hypothetical protein